MDKNISEYLNNDYLSSSMYILYRSTPSYIDGLKNSTRKLVYTLKKKNIKEETKVSALGGFVTSEAGYLHGDTSIQGAIVTTAQDYCGSNNLPIITPNGNFGTRMINEASSARYIFTKPQPYFYEIFKKEDDGNLIKQNFEGDEIEPRYYVPTLPLVLINGSSGIGVGFATKILNRDTKNIIKALKNKLNRVRINSKYFYPQWNGFKGTVIDLGNNKWQIKGIANLKSKRKVEILELPINYNLSSYIDVLKKLKEKNIIDSYDDYSENDIFRFEVQLTQEESNKDFDTIFEDLKLSTVITESLCCIDENNSIIEFNSVQDIFNKYYDVKIDYMNKRIKSEILRLTEEKNTLKEIIDFINEVINGTINLKDSNDKLTKSMTDKGYKNIDKLLSMPFKSLTKEKVKELKDKYKTKSDELANMQKETAESLWLKDIEQLEEKIA